MAIDTTVREARGTIRSRVPWDEYAALPGVSITRLKELKRSPQHYQWLLSHPRESAAMTVGSAAHVAILEPERFDRDHAVWSNRTESGDMAPRKGKAWDAFKAEHAGKRILTANELEGVDGMRGAVRSNPLAMRYLESGDPEVTMQWQHRNRPCKGRLDWLTTDGGKRVLVGLKTTRDCRHFVFGSQAAKLGYHLQWAFYFDAYREITGESCKVVEIVVESAPPHAVAVYVIPFDVIEQGRDDYTMLFDSLVLCEISKEWPGPVIAEEELTLPSWIYGQADDDVSELGLETGT